MILRVDGVTKKFGGLLALNSVSLEISRQGIYGMIGPNGSGKTTLFNVVTRVLRQESGSIYYMDKRIDDYGTARATREGIARTFQLTRVFKDLTVRENVHAATPLRSRKTGPDVDQILSEFGLTQVANQRAGQLPVGQKKLLEFARALVTDPKLILLDEPAGGLSSEMIPVIATHIKSLSERGKTIVLIEHNMSFAMNLCEWIFALDHGALISQGTPQDIRSDRKVIEAYLGETK